MQTKRKPNRARWKRPLVSVVLGSLVLAATVALIPWSLEARIGLLSILIGGVLTYVQVIGPTWTNRSSALEAPAVIDATSELNAWREILASRVQAVRTRQRDELALLYNVIDTGASETTYSKSVSQALAPKLEVRGKISPLADIVHRWTTETPRIVLLGEPGSGKTFAALTLIVHANNDQELNRSVITELFLLADWYQWRLSHPDDSMRGWMTERISSDYEIPTQTAHTLVHSDAIVPVFDGLDEIPTIDSRRDCIDQVGSLSGKLSQRRFFLTSRVREYHELAPEWVNADATLTLRHLGPDRVAQAIETSLVSHEGWDRVLALVRNNDPKLMSLLRTPLRLSLALLAYRSRDPEDLITLSLEDSENLLWELFLTPESPAVFEGHSGSDIRLWLTWLAQSMERTNRQTFALHELAFVVPSDVSQLRRIRVGVGLVSGLLAFSIIFGFYLRWLGFSPWSVGISAALALEIAWISPQLLVRLAVSRTIRVPLLARVGFGLRVLGAYTGLIFLFAVASSVPPVIVEAIMGTNERGLVGVLVTGLGIWSALSCLVFAVAVLSLEHDTFGHEPIVGKKLIEARRAFLRSRALLVAVDQPEEYAGSTPRTPLTNSLRAGLRQGAVASLACFVSVLLFVLVPTSVGGFRSRAFLWSLLIFALVVASIVGVVVAVCRGVGAVVYHAWLTRALGRRGLFPRTPARFLEWCAGQYRPQHASATAKLDRRWMRQSGGLFQFTHREMQRYLASTIDDPKGLG